MSILVSSTPPPKPKTKDIRPISLLFAGILVVVALGQLFSFEAFPARLESVGISVAMAPLLATVIVVAEVLALPFALGLHLSPAFRVVSMVCGWIVGVKLLTLAIMENITTPDGYDATLGATLDVPVGWWSICLALAVCVLAGWTSWGLWPLPHKK